MMMRGNVLHFWFLRIAVVAIGGMLWTSGSASACEVVGGSASPACCSTVPPSKHGDCCDASRPPTPTRSVPRADHAADSSAPRVFEPAPSSCECKASEPASPAEHQGRTTTERLDAEGFGLPVAVAPAMGPPPRINRSALPSGRPPKIPLHLQISRLLN